MHYAVLSTVAHHITAEVKENIMTMFSGHIQIALCFIVKRSMQLNKEAIKGQFWCKQGGCCSHNQKIFRLTPIFLLCYLYLFSLVLFVAILIFNLLYFCIGFMCLCPPLIISFSYRTLLFYYLFYFKVKYSGLLLLLVVIPQ